MSDLSEQIPAMLYGQGDRLAPLRQVIQALGNPDQKVKIIHLAGTNGKGSTSTMIAQLLRSHGMRVGLFTSPHLYSERESVQVDGQLIDASTFQVLLNKISQVESGLNLPDEQRLSQFELTFVVALCYFAQEACDWVVLECGLGGELDATNAIGRSEYSIFTKIGLDHVNLLGDTIEEIAQTKAGIMRPNQTVIIAPNQQPEVVKALIERADEFDNSWIYLEKPLAKLQEGTTYQVALPNVEPFKMQLGLRGNFQAENLTTAMLFYQAWLTAQGYVLDPDHLKTVLKEISLPGRYERVSSEPTIILDACHNLDAVAATVETLQREFKGQRLHVICGFLKDKDVTAMVHLLHQLDADFILTQPDFPERTLPVDELAKIFKAEGIEAPTFTDPREAVTYAINQQIDPIIILGSFHLIKCVRGMWRDEY